MNILHKADKLRHTLKNNITLGSVKRYVENTGYSVIFGGTKDIDRELERFNLTEYAKNKHAFVYSSLAKFIYIDGKCSEQEKLCLLLHEIFHLYDDDDNSCSDPNNINEEIQADTFAHEVLTGEHARSVRRVSVISVLATVCIVVPLAVGARLHFYPAQKADMPSQNTSVQNTDVLEEQDDYVYVLPTGTKYHTKDCRYVTQAAIAVPKDNIPDSYSPCKVCQPDEAF